MEKEKEHPLLWLALAMQLDGKKCAVCGHLYDSREKVKAHRPVKGYGDDVVGEPCWEEYLDKRSNLWD